MESLKSIKRIFSPKQKAILKILAYIMKGRASDIVNNMDSSFTHDLENMILIGTHHKTGTVWLQRIFNEICKYNTLDFYIGEDNDLLPLTDVFFHYHSLFEFDLIKKPYRGLHMIRDPRDVIISGCFYHQSSEEKWLHVPQKKFKGLTYQQKINSYKNIDDQIFFEMENMGRETIEEIMGWDYDNQYFIEIKYEDLMEDYDLILSHEIFSFLGFSGNSMPQLLKIVNQHSLFSNNNQISRSKHIRSGKKNQWIEYFKKEHQKRFIELFDDSLIQLGYETDNYWSQGDPDL